MWHIITLCADPCFGLFENLPITAFCGSVQIRKARKGSDPDTPAFKEVMIGPHWGNFTMDMHEEIKTLEDMNVWMVMHRKDLPVNVNVLPGTWMCRIKRAMDSEI